MILSKEKKKTLVRKSNNTHRKKKKNLNTTRQYDSLENLIGFAIVGKCSLQACILN